MQRRLFFIGDNIERLLIWNPEFREVKGEEAGSLESADAAGTPWCWLAYRRLVGYGRITPFLLETC